MEVKKTVIYVITGHRPKKLYDIYDLYHPLYIKIGFEIRNYLIEKINNLKDGEIIELVTGMALGIDTLYSLIAIRLKNEYPGKVKLFCVIPCLGQEERWKEADKIRYNNILDDADIIHYVSKERYKGRDTMFKRDEFMVDLIVKNNYNGELISVFNGIKEGGTYHTIKYAQDLNVPNYNINPLDYI